MLKTLFTLLGVLSLFICKGQPFIAKYPRLTMQHLPEFFEDWKDYSDSVASNLKVDDTVIIKVLKKELWQLQFEDDMDGCGSTPMYHVVPYKIQIERYYFDVDTTCALPYRTCWNMKKEDFNIDSITPVWPHGALYLTSAIDKVLSEFAGGLRENGSFSPINREHVRELERYIPVAYGHWGGLLVVLFFPADN